MYLGLNFPKFEVTVLVIGFTIEGCSLSVSAILRFPEKMNPVFEVNPRFLGLSSSDSLEELL